MVLEKILESPLGWKKTKPVHPKGAQSWVFIGRTDVEAEIPILWPPDAKNWLIGKDPDFGKVWGQEEKGTTEDEMAGWHHWLNGHEFGWAPGVGDGQGGLVCCSSWGHKESDMTEWLNWTDWLFIHLWRNVCLGLLPIFQFCWPFKWNILLKKLTWLRQVLVLVQRIVSLYCINFFSSVWHMNS